MDRSLIGKRLDDPAVPTPAVVLDKAIVTRNCQRMLQAAQSLHLQWRAHIKTHKTTEVTRLMVGETGPANLVVSTLLEAEKIQPLLSTFQQQGRPVSMLYGFPLYAAAVPRLAAVGRVLGLGSLAVLVDHPDQLAVVQQLVSSVSGSSDSSLPVFLKIDVGSARAGVVPDSSLCATLIHNLLALHADPASHVRFHGLYCHAGHSYDARQPWSSMNHLASEFGVLAQAATAVRAAADALALPATSRPLLTLSVGASPTVATLLHPELGGEANEINEKSTSGADRVVATQLRQTLAELHAAGIQLEAHAGVYPLRDLQQLATHSWAGVDAVAEIDDLALTVLADVASVYPGRGRDGSDEVLINAGVLALSREAVKNVSGQGYDGFGVVMPEAGQVNQALARPDARFPAGPADSTGWWQVGRLSQEHGILTWAGAWKDTAAAATTPAMGQRVRIWPNHACITAAMYGQFLVVDSSDGDGATVVDVWDRWVGW